MFRRGFGSNVPRLRTNSSTTPLCQQGRVWRLEDGLVTLNPQAGAGADDTVVFPTLSTEGASTRFFVDPDGSAVRGGRTTGTQWDAASRGADSTALGLDTVASGANTTALGTGATASHAGSMVWSDPTTAASSAAEDEVTFGAQGGFRVLCDGPSTPAYVPGNIYFDAPETVVTGKLTVTGLIDPTGLECVGRAAFPALPAPGSGTFWVRDDVPTVPMFTDDAGFDTELGAGGGTGGVAQEVVVSSAPSPGQFSSITAAMASITDASALKPYIVNVGPGVYVEEDIDVKSFVSVRANTSGSVTVQSFSTTRPVFNMLDDSGLWQITLSAGGIGGVGVPLVNVNGSLRVSVSSLVLVGSTDGLAIGPTAGADQLLLVEGLVTSDLTGVALRLDGTGANDCVVRIQSFTLGLAAGGAPVGIDVTGPSMQLSLIGGLIVGQGSGTGLIVRGNAVVNSASMSIRDVPVGVTDDTGGGQMALDAIEFNNVARTLDVSDAASTGHFDGYIPISSIDIDPTTAFFLTNTDNFEFTVFKKGGDFTSIGAAIAHINGLAAAPTLAQPYALRVGAGDFTEAPFTIPQFVDITGVDNRSTTVQPSNDAVDFVTADIDTRLANLAIVGPTGVGASAVVFSGGPFGAVTASTGTFFMSNVQIRGAGYALVKINTDQGATAVASCSMDTVDMVAPFLYGIEAINTLGFLVGFLLAESNHNSPSAPPPGAVDIVRTGGADTIQCIIRNCVFTDNSASGLVTGLHIEAGGSYTLTSTFTDRLASSVTVDNSAQTPAVRVNAGTLLNEVTNTISILNPNTTGVVNAIANVDSVQVAAGAVVQLLLQSPTTGEVAISGLLQQGATVAEITNVSDVLQKGGTLGVIDGGVITNTLLDVDVTAGTGYLQMPSGELRHVVWGALSATLAADSSNYLAVTNAGALLVSASAPDNSTNILLGFARTDATTVAFFQIISSQAVHTSQLLDDSTRAMFGPVYRSGSAVTDGGARDLDVTGGEYYFGTHSYAPVGGTSVSMIGYYGASSVVASFTQLATPFQYDNAGTLTNLLVTEWALHTLYVVNDGAYEQYLLLFGQTTFASLAAAQAGALPTPPSFISGNAVQIAGLIVQGTTAAWADILDVRPLPSFRAASAGAAATDHQSLTNRAAVDAHAQYLLKDGTDTMTGVLDMGTNAIANAGLINGMTVTAHAARHLPGGVDALATAVAATVGTTNTEGVAASFSRSDHVHAHGDQTGATLHAAATGGTNGFMSAADKTILDSATAVPTASALATYDAGSQLTGEGVVVATGGAGAGQQNDLHLESNNSTVASVRAPDGLAGAYTLTLPTTMGTAGYLLSTDGSTLTTWTPPPGTAAIIQRRTTSTANLNQNTQELIVWDLTDIHDVGTYTILSTSTVQVLATGRYSVYVNMVVTSSQDTNLIIKAQVNAVDVPGSARGLYISDDAGNNDSSGSFETVLALTANDIVTFTSQREGGGGSVTSISGESTFIIRTV